MFLIAEVVQTVQVDMQALTLAAGVVIPLLVGLLSKFDAPSGLKAVLNLGLSACAGALATAIEAEGSIQLSEWVTGIGMTWLISIVSYYGLWKPTGVSTTVEDKTKTFGIGSPPLPDLVTEEGEAEERKTRRARRPIRVTKKKV